MGLVPRLPSSTAGPRWCGRPHSQHTERRRQPALLPRRPARRVAVLYAHVDLGADDPTQGLLVVVGCPFGRGGPSGVAYWLWRALKAATRAATTSLRRISSVVGRMLPTEGMRRRTTISPAQVSTMCRGCRPPRRTGDSGRPHIWCPCTVFSPKLGCGRSRTGTALSRSSSAVSSGARRPLLLCPCR